MAARLNTEGVSLLPRRHPAIGAFSGHIPPHSNAVTCIHTAKARPHASGPATGDAGSSCEDDQVSSRARDVDPGRLASWCAEHLGSPPAGEIFRSGYLSAVMGLRLADDRAVVVKVRPGSPRVAACVEVQRRLFESGYPCPEPLTGAALSLTTWLLPRPTFPAGTCCRARTERRGRSLRHSRGWSSSPRGLPRCPHWTRHRRGRPGITPRPGCGHVPRTLTSTSTRWRVPGGSTTQGAGPGTGCKPARPKP